MKRQRSNSSSGRVKRQRLTPAQQAEVNRVITRRLNAVSDYKVTASRLRSDPGIAGISASGYVFDLLQNLSRGDGILNQFEGSTLFPKSIKMRFQWQFGDDVNMVRLILFQWFDKSFPSTADIIDAGVVGLDFAPLAMWHVENKPIRKILCDKTYQLVKPGTQTGNLSYVVDDCYVPKIKLKKLKMGQTAPNVQDGGLFCLLLSDSAATTHPGILLTSQVTFTDGL